MFSKRTLLNEVGVNFHESVTLKQLFIVTKS